MDGLPRDGEADLAVAPAHLLASGGTEGLAHAPPVIAWGPSSMMRAAYLAGCVDYLRDPWTPEELALRAEGALARQASRFQFPWGTVRWQGDRLLAPRGAVTLSRRQAVILRALLRCRGRAVPRAALCGLLGPGAARGSRRVDVHVSEIRRLVRAVQPDAARFITCVRGQGYMIE